LADADAGSAGMPAASRRHKADRTDGFKFLMISRASSSWCIGRIASADSSEKQRISQQAGTRLGFLAPHAVLGKSETLRSTHRQRDSRDGSWFSLHRASGQFRAYG
jgi:hypothetical protein